MGACCQVAIDTDQFKQYCMENAGHHYQPILNRVQGKIRLDQKQPYCVQGSWDKGGPQTGKGVIYCFQRFYYEGDIINRIAEGKGRIIWPSRYIYSGDVSNNKAQGQGQLQIEQKKITVRGQWVNGLPKLNQQLQLTIGQNKGSLIFIYNQEEENEKPQPVKQQDYFISKNVQVAIDFGNGITYQGQLLRKNDHYQIEGQGIMKFKDGSYYKGQFENGQMHGHGKYFWGDRGHWYEGYYQNNLRQGIGRYYYNEQQFDMGHWSKGRLRSNTAQSYTKKQGEDHLVKSGYTPKIQEYSLPKIQEKEPIKEVKNEEEVVSKHQEDGEVLQSLAGKVQSKHLNQGQQNEVYTPVNEVNEVNDS